MGESTVSTFQSLKEIKHERYYIGLTWYALDGTLRKSDLNKKLSELQDLTERRFGVIKAPSGASNDYLIGMAPELTTAYYSAAMLVNSIVTASNYIFVQDLGNGQFWYLLVIDGNPATGNNDCVINNQNDVFEKIIDDRLVWDLETRKILYLIPQSIQDLLEEVGLDKQDFKVVTFSDLYDTANDYSVARIRELNRIQKRFKVKLSSVLKFALTVAIVGVAYTIFFAENNKPTVNNLDAELAKKREQILAKRKQAELIAVKTKSQEDTIYEEAEESKWISQQLNSGSPADVIQHLQDYVRSLPANLAGWYPAEIDYNLRFKIDHDKSSLDTPARLDLLREIKTRWENGGESTIGEFRASLTDDSNLIYTLNGTSATETQQEKVIDHDVLTIDGVREYLDGSKDSYLKIISMLQEFKLQSPKNFRWNASVKYQNERLVPYIYKSSDETQTTNTISYSKVIVIVEFEGFGSGFELLRNFSTQLNKFKGFVITEIKIPLKDESIQLTGYYIHPNISING